jgi:uncharacterized protein
MKEDALKHGAFGWMELMTSDHEGAVKFYSSLFGWEAEKYQMENMDCADKKMEGMEYTFMKVDGEPVGGIMPAPPEHKNVPPFWSAYVTVDDVDATAARVEELGGRVLRAPINIPTIGRFCVIRDPQGGTICAITYEKK